MAAAMASPTSADPEVRTRSADLPTESIRKYPEVRTGESRSADEGGPRAYHAPPRHRRMYRLAVLLGCVPCAVAPKLSFVADLTGTGPATDAPQTRASDFALASGAALAVSAAVVGAAFKQPFCTHIGGTAPASVSGAGTSARGNAGMSTAFRRPPPWDASNAGNASSVCGDVSENSSEDSDSEASDAAPDEPPEPGTEQTPGSSAPALKLWTNAQFPEGTHPMSCNWDMANLQAAQNWTCPCTDRRNCIGSERGLGVLQLYELRKTGCAQDL